MEKTVTFTITESEAKRFEKLLDDFIETVKFKNNSQSSEEDFFKMQTETQLLLSQAKEELKKIKEFNANRKEMIWEQ